MILIMVLLCLLSLPICVAFCMLLDLPVGMTSVHPVAIDARDFIDTHGLVRDFLFFHFEHAVDFSVYTVDGVRTVSYTHLDVYKRQTQIPVRSCFG